MACPLVGTLDYSQTVGTTAVQIFTAGQIRPGLQFMRIWNVAPSNGGTVWLSRSGNPAAVGAAGSYPLGPGQYELFTLPQAIPKNALSAIADTAGTPLTVEVG